MTLQSRRAIWIVLDGVGLEALPDAREYSDEDAATLPHVAAACGGLNLPNMGNLGLGCLAEIEGVPPAPEPFDGQLIQMDVVGIRRTGQGKFLDLTHWENVGVFGRGFRY